MKVTRDIPRMTTLDETIQMCRKAIDREDLSDRSRDNYNRLYLWLRDLKKMRNEAGGVMVVTDDMRYEEAMEVIRTEQEEGA